MPIDASLIMRSEESYQTPRLMNIHAQCLLWFVLHGLSASPRHPGFQKDVERCASPHLFGKDVDIHIFWEKCAKMCKDVDRKKVCFEEARTPRTKRDISGKPKLSIRS